MAEPERYTLDQFVESVRRLVRSEYPGRRPLRVALDLDDGEAIRLPIPGEAAPACRHSPDFRSVSWHGAEHHFTAGQAAAVRTLWEAWQAGTPDVGQAALLEAAGSDGGRLRDLFKGSDAWGEMVVPGAAKGTYRLYDPAP